MSAQYIVAVLLGSDLNVTAVGPFRSRKRAEAACERINKAGEWSEDEAVATIVADVVRLESVAEVVRTASGGES